MAERITWTRKGWTQEFGTVDGRELFCVDIEHDGHDGSDRMFLSGPLVPVLPLDRGGMGALEFPLSPVTVVTGRPSARQVRELVAADRARWDDARATVRATAEKILVDFATSVLSGKDTSA